VKPSHQLLLALAALAVALLLFFWPKSSAAAPLGEALLKEELLQAQRDTPAATETLSHACLGEVAMMMGSGF